ncbi:MAG: L7Ae/L30e/S12e/Gadd45 family ribosomal protein [Evtepia gabavorous]
MDSIPSLLGLALRAGRLAVGEEPVGVACRCHKGYLLLASDAADNTIRRALHFCQAGKTICLTLPLTKQELGSGLGRASCAMLALTDVGFARRWRKSWPSWTPRPMAPPGRPCPTRPPGSRNAARKSAPPTKTRARAGPENESRTAHPTTAAKGMDKRRSHTL